MFGKTKKEIFKEINTELYNALHRRNDDISLRFVCYDDIKKIWTQERIERISKGFKWAKGKMLVLKEFVRVLSTLVWIHWDDWESFGDHFLDVPKRSDNDLPLPDTTFLGSSSFVNGFAADQYIFIPAVLEEDDPFSDPGTDYLYYSKHHRLPSLSSKKIGRGAFGTVTKEVIAPGYFKFRGGDKNIKNYCVAVKRFEHSDQLDHEDFKSEHQNLKVFKQCLDKHPNIMLSLTTFAHGTQFIIISPLADLDLREFFEGKHGDIEKRRKDFTPRALLKEAECLASALHFLHDGLQTRDRQMACAHLDLKPENILVQWSSPDTHPVGCWKIHDFGTSRIKDSSTETPGLARRDLLAPGDFISQFSLTAPRQFSLTTPRRPPGTFQAPEVQSSQERVVGRESDMWSFGCILAFILAFATGGPDNVQQLFKSLYRKDSRGMKNDFFYTIQEADTIVRPAAKAWLEHLQSDNDHERLWVSKTRKLIFDLLKVHPNERLKANKVCDTLQKICLEGGFQFEKPCPWPVTRAESFSFRRGHANALLSNSDSGALASPTTTRETIESSNSSAASQILTLTDEISFTKLKTPGKTFKTAVCSASCHIAFLSKGSATIHSITDKTTWAPKPQKLALLSSTASSIACPNGYDWNYISISDNYIILRSREQRGEREKIHRYHFDSDNSPQWNEEPWVNSGRLMDIHAAAENSVDMVVSCRGDVLFMGSETLFCYSSGNGLKELEIAGQLQRCGASFSTDGKFIYGWSYDKKEQKNYWYVWKTETSKQLKHHFSRFRPATNPNGRDTLFPLSTYFVAFERPDRLRVIGKDANKFEAKYSKTIIKNIIAGTGYQITEVGDEALILVSSNGSLILLQLHPESADFSDSTCELGTAFDPIRDGISVLTDQDGSSFVVIAHSDGLLTRRRISNVASRG